MKAVRFYTQDACLVWMHLVPDSTPEYRTITGKHSIHHFLKIVPELIYEITSYDCQSITGFSPLGITVVTVSGNAHPVETESPCHPYSFHSTFHIQMVENETRAAIVYHTMNLFAAFI